MKPLSRRDMLKTSLLVPEAKEEANRPAVGPPPDASDPSMLPGDSGRTPLLFCIGFSGND
jgi:hypothetical protein